MKWNWGTKIVIAFVIFCGLMIFMVIKSFEQDFHLVTENYYQEELAYQERIDAIENTSRKGLIPNLEGTAKNVIISFELTDEKYPTGDIQFYRPENANLDRFYDIKGLETVIPKSELARGRYILKIDWEFDGEKYYYEKEVSISK